MFRNAPTHDLARLRLGPKQIEDIYDRWANRALGELVPRALTELGYASDAEAWTKVVPFGLDRAAVAYELCRSTRHRIWPYSDAPSAQELAFHILGLAEGPVADAARRSGHIRTVQTTWSEETGPGEVIPWTEEELAEMARLDPIGWAILARSIAHTLHGSAGFAAELKREYDELATIGIHGPYEGAEWGTGYGGSHLVGGRRYRVYEAFVDAEGQHHPWGESWRFEKFVMDTDRCTIELHVGESTLLDTKLSPVEPLRVGTFRLPWSIGDKPGYPKEPLEFLITTV